MAVVRIDGRDHYLGKYDSSESWEKYHHLVADFLRGVPSGSSLPSIRDGFNGDGPPVNQVILSYWQFAQVYYKKNGQPTGETDNTRAALRPLRKLFGGTPASRFGLDALELVRDSMIESGLCRNVVNARVSRIKVFVCSPIGKPT